MALNWEVSERFQPDGPSCKGWVVSCMQAQSLGTMYTTTTLDFQLVTRLQNCAVRSCYVLTQNLLLDSLTEHINWCSNKHQNSSVNVWCPTVISGSVCHAHFTYILHTFCTFVAHSLHVSHLHFVLMCMEHIIVQQSVSTLVHWNRYSNSKEWRQTGCKQLYRGMTILPITCMSKVLFAIISKRFCVWAESKQILPVEQFGFQSLGIDIF